MKLLKNEIYKKKEPIDIAKNDAEDIAIAVRNTISPDGMFKMNMEGDIIPFGSEIINNMEKTPFMDLLSKASKCTRRRCKRWNSNNCLFGGNVA